VIRRPCVSTTYNLLPLGSMLASLVKAKPSARIRARLPSTMQTKPSFSSGCPNPVIAFDSGSERVVTVIQMRPCSSWNAKFAREPLAADFHQIRLDLSARSPRPDAAVV
jgi:hypothetical protein